MDITLILVTILSLLLAGVMTMLAWRLAEEERRRSQARVSALAAEIHRDDLREIHRDDLPLWPGSSEPSESAPGARVETWGRNLFSATQAPERSSRAPAIVALAALAGSVAIAVIVGGSHTRTNAKLVPGSSRTRETNAATAAVDTRPLELTALTHEREADRLTVRGVIRNPASGTAVDRLTVVVFLFNRDGGFVASGRAVIHASGLAPGAESSFVVSIPNATDVGRYRVSFRTDDHVVPHIDRRHRAIAQAKQL